MAYQAFYNKYRPQTFKEVVGQKAIVTTLENAIKEDKIAHAYLFCGPRGTGKTTMARLFAKALDCQEGVGHQCNHCDSCEKIMHGQHPDVIEIDAASNSTVDSVRQLIENVSYQPLLSRYKVYIIDEVHNMSDSAFNALLKTIEEPPSFVVFILATTDPQKVLPTILSRVQRFDFSKVSDDDLIKNMKRVLDSEDIKYEDDALRLISSLSDGGVRDSLSLLDKVVSYCGDDVKNKDVNDLLGLLSLSEEINLINSIAKNKADVVLKEVKERYQQGLDIRRFRNDLLNILKDFLIYNITRDKSLLEHLKEDEVTSIHLSIDEARYYIDVLMQNLRDTRLSDDTFTQFELALISMMSPRVSAPVIQQVQQTSNTPEKLKKAETTEERKPIEIVSNKENKGFIAKAPTEENSTDTIKYTKDDILYLMNHFDKDTKKVISQNWMKLNSFCDSDMGFEAKALSGCKPCLFSQGILIVTNMFATEVNKINKKSAQLTLTKLSRECFGKAYNILPMSQEEFMGYYTAFQCKEQPKEDKCSIDFGVKVNIEASTEFFENLFDTK